MIIKGEHTLSFNFYKKNVIINYKEMKRGIYYDIIIRGQVNKN